MTLLFRIKREDARRAVRVLYEEDSVPPRDTLEALREIRDDVDGYIHELEQETDDR